MDRLEDEDFPRSTLPRPFVARRFTPSTDPEALRIQAMALHRMCSATEAQLHHYRQKDYSNSEPRLASLEAAVESEREMNAILTAELEKEQQTNQILLTRIKELTTP